MKTIGIVLTCLVFSMSSTVIGGTDGAADIRTLTPDSVPKPYKNRFSHGKLVPAGAEWLVTAGQTGANIDGQPGVGIEEQADLAMRNLYNIVQEAGMNANDVVKMTIYYLDPEYLPVIIAARNRYFGEDFRPASTAVGVSALARPDFLVEVEAIAARMPE